jgi:hypothetical protein
MDRHNAAASVQHHLVILVAAAAILATPWSLADEDTDLDGPVTWQVLWQNDEYDGTDNQFTNGIGLKKHSRLFSSLTDTGGTLAFGKWLARPFLPEDSSLHYRESWTLGQNMQTPDDIQEKEVLLNDVPYVGMIGWSNSFIAFDDERFTGFGMLLGWTGEGTLAEETQRAAHNLTGASDPEGWDNQLEFEPLVNLYFVKKRKLWRLPHFDGAIGVDVAAGNFFSFGQTALEMRFGNVPEGFAPTSDPLGRGLNYSATLHRPGAVYTYATLAARVTGLLWALPRQGNTFRNNEWTDNNTIDLERGEGQLVFGLHHERPNWGVHFNFLYSTSTVEGNNGPLEDRNNNYGTITLEWRR